MFFIEARNKFVWFYTIFWVKQAVFAGANQYSEITGFFFKDLKLKWPLLRVNETKITAENTFNPDHLWMESNHEAKNESKTFF